MLRSAEYWLTRVLIGERQADSLVPEPQKPEIDPEFLLDTINSFGAYAQSEEGRQRKLRTVRISKGRMVAWFDPDGLYQYKAIKVELVAPNTRFVYYTGRNQDEISDWRLQYCGSTIREGELEDQIRAAISKARFVISDSFRERALLMGTI